jgi:chromate transport protein ChrA
MNVPDWEDGISGEKGICRWAATGLPGSVALWVQAGMDRLGRRDGVLAGTLFVLPSLFVLLDLSAIYFKFGNLPWIAEMFDSLKPAGLNPSTA